MHLAHRILTSLGANEVAGVDSTMDPVTAEDFAGLKFISPTPITWEQYCAARPAIELKFGLRFLKKERTKRLSACDWVMTVDNADTLANKSEWVAYRQALRDLPNNPPPFVWKGLELDFSKMAMPVEPPVLRIPSA
jgi:hypothetical protein